MTKANIPVHLPEKAQYEGAYAIHSYNESFSPYRKNGNTAHGMKRNLQRMTASLNRLVRCGWVCGKNYTFSFEGYISIAGCE